MIGRKKNTFILFVIFISFAFSQLVCRRPMVAQQIYKVAVLPEYLAIEMWQRLQPLMTYLEDTSGVRFELIIPRSFEQHIEMVRKERVDFSYQNPYVFLQVWENSSPLTLTENRKGMLEFRGLIITRRDSGINGIEGLRGKKVSIVSLHSAGGFIAQKIFLQNRGLDVHADLSIVETSGNRQENVIFDVVLKRTHAGFVGEEVFGRIESKGLLSPGALREIKVIAYTKGIPNWVFSARKNLPLKVKKMVQETLLNIPFGHQVLKTAKIRRFAPIAVNHLQAYRAKVQSR